MLSSDCLFKADVAKNISCSLLPSLRGISHQELCLATGNFLLQGQMPTQGGMHPVIGWCKDKIQDDPTRASQVFSLRMGWGLCYDYTDVSCLLVQSHLPSRSSPKKRNSPITFHKQLSEFIFRKSNLRWGLMTMNGLIQIWWASKPWDNNFWKWAAISWNMFSVKFSQPGVENKKFPTVFFYSLY